MADSRRVEIIPTEELASYVAGPDGDRLATVGHWSRPGKGDWSPQESGTWRAEVSRADHRPTTGRPTWAATVPVTTAPIPVDYHGAAFRRMFGVAGDRLGAVLNAWWWQAPHDDDHLRLDAPHRDGETWSLTGAFRPTVISRWLPVELLLWPHLGRWTKLELAPLRAVHPNRVYFRAGHRSLDRFVDAMHAQDALASN